MALHQMKETSDIKIKKKKGKSKKRRGRRAKRKQKSKTKRGQKEKCSMKEILASNMCWLFAFSRFEF
jgi:hypothetical protein